MKMIISLTALVLFLPLTSYASFESSCNIHCMSRCMRNPVGPNCPGVGSFLRFNASGLGFSFEEARMNAELNARSVIECLSQPKPVSVFLYQQTPNKLKATAAFECEI